MTQLTEAGACQHDLAALSSLRDRLAAGEPIRRFDIRLLDRLIRREENKQQREKLNRIVTQYRQAGVNWSAWARQHGFRLQAVKDVVCGRARCKRGESFRVAVALGAIPAPPPELQHLSSPTETEDAA